VAEEREKRFTAVLERTGDRFNWTIVRVPFDVRKTWGTSGKLRVKGEIHGPENATIAIRASLLPTGKGTHYLLVNKQMQAGAKVAAGMRARFRLEPDRVARPVRMPSELACALNEDRRLRRWFDALSNSMRRWFADSVSRCKNAETRERHAAQYAELLFQVMEAEQGELPPLLQQIFARNPEARAGWERMPPGQRRHHLMGMLYPRSPEARQKRLHAALAAMLQYARKDRGRCPD
jgi:uncharacterized protein YdeI (YjbR/CyaY-like superfamily)